MSYADFHAPRFAYLLRLVDRFRPAGARVLDVGPSPLTDTLRRHLAAPVDSLGLEPDADSSAGRHVQFDLNSLAAGAQPPPLPSYGLIVFAEVLEHLHAPPQAVLRFLRAQLAGGGVLILQTPNAASLAKRLKLAAGRQPYEMIREDRKNPGHIREYTLGELRELAARAGFRILACDRRYYFDARFADVREDGSGGRPRPIAGAIKNVVYRALPPFLREGITLVMDKM